MKSPKVTIEEGVYCYNIDSRNQCAAYNQMDCSVDCPARVGSLQALKKLYRSLVRTSSSELMDYRRRITEITEEMKEEQDRQIRAAWNEDIHRGSRGGSSESDSNNRAGIKQRMKDNRLVECKLTKTERDEIKAATEKWEAENGKLPRLSRSILSRGKSE